MGKKRRGNKPDSKHQHDADAATAESARAASLASEINKYPAISFRFLESGWGFEELQEVQVREFLEKWQKRCGIQWKELSIHPRHGLGAEQIPKKSIKPSIPRVFSDVEKFHVYRHQGNLPVVGWKNQNVFYPIWIEAKYNDLYDHGS